MNRVTSKDGTAIAFDRSGKGPAIILVGGALADRSAGAPLAALLAPHLTVFTYDRRGKGDSGDTTPYAVEREVEDIDALIKAAGGSAFVFGMSSGAVLALEAAARGLAITKLALYEPPFIVDGGRAAMPKDFAARLTELVSSGRRGDALELYMTKAMGVPDQMLAQMRQAPMWAGMEKIAHTLVYEFMIMGDTQSGNPSSLKRWAAVTIPTFVMDGGASPAWMHNAAQSLADILPHSARRTLEDQTHAVDPAILARALEEFFTG